MPWRDVNPEQPAASAVRVNGGIGLGLIWVTQRRVTCHCRPPRGCWLGATDALSASSPWDARGRGWRQDRDPLHPRRSFENKTASRWKAVNRIFVNSGATHITEPSPGGMPEVKWDLLRRPISQPQENYRFG